MKFGSGLVSTQTGDHLGIPGAVGVKKTTITILVAFIFLMYKELLEITEVTESRIESCQENRKKYNSQ